MVLLLVCGAQFAAAEEKVAFINMREILFLSDAGKKAAGELQEVLKAKQAEIKTREAELQQQKEALEKQRLVLTETAMREKELEHQREVRDFKRFVEDSKAEIQRKDEEFSRKLVPDIAKVVNDLGEKEGYTMILDISSTAGLAYHAKGREITKEVIKEFNKAYKLQK